MKLSMHICCANCSTYPIRTLRGKGISVYGLWYNPNIHPVTEYYERLRSVRALQDKWGLEVDYIDDYGLKEFVRNVSGRENDRCNYCYSTRLEETAIKAKENGFDAFTTSLLVSPYQKFDLILKIGNSMAEKYNIEFLGNDFRSGFKEGRNISRQMGLYSQKYCGCIYSEMERFMESGP